MILLITGIISLILAIILYILYMTVDEYNFKDWYIISLFAASLMVIFGVGSIAYYFKPDRSSHIEYCNSLKAKFLESKELSDYYVYHVECE